MNSNKSLSRQKLTFYVTILIVLLVASTVFLLRYLVKKEEKKARSFVSQVIASIHEETDFYKEKCDQNALRSIQRNLDKIKTQYNINLVDSSPFHFFEYNVIFKNSISFYCSVIGEDDESFVLHSFYPIKVN